ncbi:MAG: hypothetical protein A3I61_18385 [Acidobacteria bacterium RIFCSPLOWO2_02_FULL_68_18]|nr:MAG: hypothetical protein A3I61_18385 [Acidobacteria bacterium RIFCSPLOWO2_02_FULL_68_18]OFW48020.1 MAG: hypothetical protein A3G77_11000 [Acidobacteria bacterium RIFCSPLOWO2_12_FULL_68_19]
MFVHVLVSIAVALTAVSAAAQQSITMSGQVTDPSGAVAADVVIEAATAGRPVATATSGADGRYRLVLPSGGRYVVRARLAGFADATADLAPTADVVHDFALQIPAFGDSLVVTASRVAGSRAAAPESTTVITREAIAAAGVSQLADLLRRVPGASVESTGREGAVASLFARGGESDYNHVLVDGVRVNANGGQFDFSRISAAEIERIEVVRGAQSALYGSDAIGSVVQIFTRRAAAGDPPQLTGSVGAGSFTTRRADLHLLGGARTRVDYQLGVAYRGTDGAFSDLLPEDDRFDQTTVTGGIGAVVGDRVSVRSGVRYGEARGRGVGPIALGSRDTGTAADTEDLSWHLDATERLGDSVSHTATVSYVRASRLSADRVGDPPFTVFAVLTGRPGAIFPDSPRLVRLVDGATFDALRTGGQALPAGQFLAWTPFGVADFPFASEVALRRPAFRYQLDARWRGAHILSGGYEYERERNPLAEGFRVASHAYFLQQRFTWRDRWFLTVGGRVDDNSRYGTEVSPKASAGAFLRPFRSAALSSVKVFANIGRGIKNPLFGELFGSAFTDGNPDLHPERARTFDAGAELTFDSQRWMARGTFFDNRYTDQVAFRATGFGLDGRPDFLNIDGSTAHGWELEAALQRPIRGLTLGATYTFADTEVVAFLSTSEQFQPGQPLLRRPRHTGSVQATYVAGRAAVHLDARVVGERHDAAFLGLSTVSLPGSAVEGGRSVDITVNPGYAVVGIGGDYRLGGGLTLFVRVDNVLDEAYAGALGFPGLPRAIEAGARFTIGGR